MLDMLKQLLSMQLLLLFVQLRACLAVHEGQARPLLAMACRGNPPWQIHRVKCFCLAVWQCDACAASLTLHLAKHCSVMRK